MSRDRECVKKAADARTYTWREYDAYILHYIGRSESWEFYDDGKWTHTKSNKVLDTGTWECDGNDNYFVTAGDYTFSSKLFDWVFNFGCIENYFKERGVEIITWDDAKGVRISTTTLWIFYKPNSDDRQRWINKENSVVTERGDWACDGDSNFTIKKDGGGTYSSQTGDSDSDTSDTTDTSDFPLKFDSRGPKVVQLQHFLNEKGTGTKLVTDGIFGNKTKDKLVQYQKDNNLI